MSAFARPASLAAAVPLAGLLLLAGCAAPRPAAQPEAPRLAPWQAPVPAQAAAVADASWWRRFDDPLLPWLIEAAQAASPSLASARTRIEQARATRVAAGAVLASPEVSLAGSASRGVSRLGLPLTSSASLGAQASWELDLFGANRAARDAAQARLEGARAAWHDAHTAVAAELATGYVTLRGCEAQLVQSRLDADSREQTTRLTELSAKAGFTAPADAALARASAAQARAQVVVQRSACDVYVKSLVELTELDETTLRQRLAAGTARIPVPPTLAVPTVPAMWLTQRPDVADAARRVSAAAADRAQSAAREKPQITLAGNLSASDLRSGGETLRGNTWSLGPLSVSFPLLDGGARAAATAAAMAAYDESLVNYRAQVRRAVREVETSLVTLQATAERETDARLAAQDFEASLRATEARQKGGLASLFDLETARRNAVAAQSALIELQRERAAAWVSLYRALGGGFDEALLAAAPAP